MASGSTHFTANVVTLGITTLAVTPLYYFGITDLQQSGAIIIGSIAGIIITPDYDLEQVVYPMQFLSNVLTWWIPNRRFRRSIYETLNKTQEAIWSFYSIPVRHRSFLTHFPGLSTILRILYLVFILLFFWHGVSLFTPEIFNPVLISFGNFYLKYQSLIWLFILGMSIQDFVHFALDDFKLFW